MVFGVAYYPEHWPRERWSVDAKMMQEAGVNGVRMGEFAWSKIEPAEGRYDFGWLDEAVTLFAQHGIKTMMCTSSRTPPPWVFSKYPEIRNTQADGRVANYGQRYTICLHNSRFIELSQRIDRAIIEHYADNPHVVAWHIDNEIGAGNACYCDTCRAAFVEHLREKYGTVGELNEKWGAHFWSFSLSAFEDVPLPGGNANPALALEWARFQSETNVRFGLWRYKLMKELCPDRWVTTNFQQSRATHTDIFRLGEATDVYGTNFYPPTQDEFGLDFCRGKRGKLIILEQRSGQPHWSSHTKPGWMRLWAWRSIAHGACGINFFRWRSSRWGQEEYWHGVLPHSGRPNRRYRELAKMGDEIAELGGMIDMTRPRPQIAMVLSYESRWALNAVLRNPAMRAISEAYAYHGALMEDSFGVDAMDPREDLSDYRLVIAPRLYCVDHKTAGNLEHFVQSGGTLCLTPRSGVVDEYNMIHERPAPGLLARLAGVEVDDYGALEGPARIRGCGARFPEEGVRARAWADEILTNGASVVACYDEGWLAGEPAVTVNEVGRGRVVYVGTLLRDESLGDFTRWLAELAGVQPVLKTPRGVRAHERRSDDLRLLFILNYGDRVRQVPLGSECTDAFTGERVWDVAVAPSDLRIVVERLT